MGSVESDSQGGRKGWNLEQGGGIGLSNRGPCGGRKEEGREGEGKGRDQAGYRSIC